LSRTQIRAARRDAERGDAVAQYNLGVWHLRDNPQGPDPAGARRWLEAAAAQGHAGALCALGYLQLAGGSDFDPAAARRCFARAAGQGHPDAQLRLAEMYITGFAGAADAERARGWFAKAARMGHTAAQSQLAYCLEHAIGGDADAVSATRWLQEAARLGDVRARIALGARYARGHTLPRDRAAALACFLAAGDHPVAAAAAARLEAELDEPARAGARNVPGPLPDPVTPDAGLAAPRAAARSEALSWAPRVFRLRELLDEEECAHLLDLGRAQIAAAGGGSAASLGGPVRDALVWNVERRIAEQTFLPPSLGDAFSVTAVKDAWQAAPTPAVPGAPASPPVLVSLVAALAGDGVDLEFAAGSGSTRLAAGDALAVFHTFSDGRPDPAVHCAVVPAGTGPQWLALKRIRAAARVRDADGLYRAS
jgi:TPR repeat protein